MIEYAIEEKGKKISATPDYIVVPQWGLRLELWKVPSIVLTYHTGTLYAASSPSVHTTIYNEYKLTTPGFDCRLAKEEKAFTFWYCKETDHYGKDKVIQWVKEIRELFRNGNFLTATSRRETPPGRIDISDYTFYFLGVTPEGKDCVTRCSYDEFIEGNFELRDAKRVWSPAYGVSIWEKRRSKDTAERHLLKYEE